MTEQKVTSSKSLLPSSVFDVKVSTQAIFDTIISDRASLRNSTHKTKGRGEVRGGGKKPFAQKHTGRARAGSTRSPIWVGGGTVHGPAPERNYKLKVNKKVRLLALFSVLTLKAKNDAVIVNDIVLQDKPSTKMLLEELKKLNLKNTQKKILIVTENPIVFKSASNVQTICANKFSGINVEMIAWADVVILTKDHIKALEERVGE